jgi:hypothetical protein
MDVHGPQVSTDKHNKSSRNSGFMPWGGRRIFHYGVKVHTWNLTDYKRKTKVLLKGKVQG